MYEKEILLLICASALVLYLLATKDNEYIPIKEREPEWKSNRNVINYWGWRGPMFIDDFQNFTTDNTYQETVPVSRPNPYIGVLVQDHSDKQKLKQCHIQAKAKCVTPVLTSENDFRNEYWNSPYWMRAPSDKGQLCHKPDWAAGDPGNFKQATNNNLDAPNNLTCQGRSIMGDYCESDDKVSPVCYTKELELCMKGT
jgi:hypothetical protein